MHGAYGTTVGRDEVIEGSLMRIAATPDRVGQAEDVIWEARGDDAFLSSHLVLSVDPRRHGLSSAGPSPTACTAAAGWSRSGSSATPWPSRCTRSRTPTSWRGHRHSVATPAA